MPRPSSFGEQHPQCKLNIASESEEGPLYTEVELPQGVRDALTALDVPVRVLGGNARAFQPPTSWRGHARANGTTIEQCEAEGVTLVSWGADEQSGAGWQFWPGLPASLTTHAPVAHDEEWVVPAAGTDDEASLAADGRVFARVGERTVWYPFRLEYLPWDYVNYDALINEPIRLARSGVDEARRLREEQERERQAADARAAFVNAAVQRQQGQLGSLRSEQQAAELTIRNYERSLAELMGEMAARERTIRALAEQGGVDREAIEAQWNALMGHEKVAAIRRESVGGYGECTVIETTELDLENPDTGETHPLGRIAIYLPDDMRREITMRNLSGRRSNRDHPHVLEGGPCFGSAHTLVYQLRNDGELPSLLEVLLQYLQSYNPQDSWGHYAYLWGFGGGPDEDEEPEEEPEEESDAGCQCYECRRARGEI